MGCNQILDRYIEQLIETSTPQAPAWNIEKIRAGKENTWYRRLHDQGAHRAV